MKAIRSNMTGDTILHCPICDAEYSGNKWDYFWLADDDILQCSECGVEMELVHKVVTVTYLG